MSTDLQQNPEAIIRLYSYRVKIECTFREMKQVIGEFCYQFWSKSMPRLNRFQKKGAPSPIDKITDPKDREFERFMSENNAVKCFAGFCLTEKTPDYTTICKFRNAIGYKQVANIFAEVRRQLQCKGYIAEVFTFVDTTALISKLTMWEERDKSIQDGYEKFNNEIISK